jgi:hypothetical protein
VPARPAHERGRAPGRGAVGGEVHDWTGFAVECRGHGRSGQVGPDPGAVAEGRHLGPHAGRQVGRHRLVVDHLDEAVGADRHDRLEEVDAVDDVEAVAEVAL